MATVDTGPAISLLAILMPLESAVWYWNELDAAA